MQLLSLVLGELKYVDRLYPQKNAVFLDISFILVIVFLRSSPFHIYLKVIISGTGITVGKKNDP